MGEQIISGKVYVEQASPANACDGCAFFGAGGGPEELVGCEQARCMPHERDDAQAVVLRLKTE